MTAAERFQKAVQAILSVPPERAEEINRQVEHEYETAPDREGRRVGPGRGTKLRTDQELELKPPRLNLKSDASALDTNS